MKTQLLTLGLIFINLSQLFSQNHSIGHTTINFVDSSRNNRVIQTEIYYPASTQGNNVPAIQGAFPVIVFGHGFVMAWDAYENLWTELVPQGYIMAFPRTEGNAFSTNHQRFGWDLQFLVTRMQQESGDIASILYNTMAPETALMGHSMGGGASFLAADSLCVNGNINLKTLVGLAPAESTSNGVSSINSAKSVTVPSLIFSGAQDGVTPPNDHHIPMYDSLNAICKNFISITGGAHCYFAEPNFNCDFGESTSSTGISITRSEQHQTTNDFLNLWLAYTLKGDCNAFDIFNDSLTNSTRVVTQQQCYSNLQPSINYSMGQLFSSVSGVSYQWYLNGNPLPGETQISTIPQSQGNYTVEVFFQDGCSKTSLPYSFVSTSISENQSTTFYIYPNPTKSYLIIDGLKDHKVRLLSIDGKRLDITITGNKIDTSRLPSGIYVLNIESNFYKFIKE